MPSVLKKIIRSGHRSELIFVIAILKNLKEFSKSRLINQRLLYLLNNLDRKIIEDPICNIVDLSIDLVVGKTKFKKQAARQLLNYHIEIDQLMHSSLDLLENNYLVNIEAIQSVLSDLEATKSNLLAQLSSDLNDCCTRTELLNLADLNLGTNQLALELLNHFNITHNFGIDILELLDLEVHAQLEENLETIKQRYAHLMLELNEDLEAVKAQEDAIKIEYESKRNEIVKYYNNQLTDLTLQINKGVKKTIKKSYINGMINIVSYILGGVAFNQISVLLGITNKLYLSLLKTCVLTIFNNSANKELIILPKHLLKNISITGLINLTSHCVQKNFSNMLVLECSIVKGCMVGTIESLINGGPIIKKIIYAVIHDLTNIIKTTNFISTIDLDHQIKTKALCNNKNVIISNIAIESNLFNQNRSAMYNIDLNNINNRFDYLYNVQEFAPYQSLYDNEFRLSINNNKIYNNSLIKVFDLFSYRINNSSIGFRPYIQHSYREEHVLPENSHFNVMNVANETIFGINLFRIEREKFSTSLDLVRFDNTINVNTLVTSEELPWPLLAKKNIANTNISSRGSMIVGYIDLRDLFIPFLGKCQATVRGDLLGFNTNYSSSSGKSLFFAYDLTASLNCQVLDQSNSSPLLLEVSPLAETSCPFLKNRKL